MNGDEDVKCACPTRIRSVQGALHVHPAPGYGRHGSGASVSRCSCGRWFTALDWHLHGCWSGCSHVQYDEPPSILHERERFLTYDMLCEALARNGVLAPIRYEYL